MNKTEFFDTIRKATLDGPKSIKTELPNWNADSIESEQQPKSSDPLDTWNSFKQRFETVKGESLEGVSSLVSLLGKADCKNGYVAPELASKVGPYLQHASIEFESEFDDSRVDDYAFGITRAAGVIAESGTVILKENSTSSRLAALAPWIHIAIIDSESKLYPTLLEAVEDLGDDPYVVFATGPSKTADVEGILIEGVHGPGRQICCKL